MACGNSSKMSKSASDSSNSSRSSKSASEKKESSKQLELILIARNPPYGFCRKEDFFIRLFEIMDYISHG